MKAKTKNGARYVWAACGACAALAALFLLLWPAEAPRAAGDGRAAAEGAAARAEKEAAKKTARPEGVRRVPGAAAADDAAGADDAEAEDGAGEADADAQTDEERRVDAFDALTDAWQAPAAEKVTMDEVRRFRETFDKVPKARRSECLHRALNLVPDENVMLLAGILFDTTQEREILEDVYNDILNRGEDVKKPILQQIFKDREHPCWADTAWILDVTGELPNDGKKRSDK